MSARYDEFEPYGMRADWERRLRRVENARGHFAWGAFLLGALAGAIIF